MMKLPMHLHPSHVLRTTPYRYHHSDVAPTHSWQRFTRESVRVSPWRTQPPEQMTRKKSKHQRKTDLSGRLCPECDRGDKTYLHAALNNHNACLHHLQMMDKHGVSGPPLDVRDGFGASALHFACRSGNLEMVQWLVENMVNIRAEARFALLRQRVDSPMFCRNGATALHDAAASGHLMCMQCLLFHDRSLAHGTLNDNEMHPLHLAALVSTRNTAAYTYLGYSLVIKTSLHIWSPMKSVPQPFGRLMAPQHVRRCSVACCC